MDKHIRIKVPEEIFNQVQEVSDTLRKRGWKQKDTVKHTRFIVSISFKRT